MSNITNDFERIVIEDIPLIDVRAPIEYKKGAFKNAINMPIMNDEERHQVGICYKEKGNDAATKLGHQLVSGKTKEKRIKNWIAYLNEKPNSLFYCFRGGSRSKISQKWLEESTGKSITRLDGGYKAFRNYLIQSLHPDAIKSTPLLIGGYTGSGKTLLLKQLDHSIDLEGIAHHRGSSFGQYIDPQPSQINFENNLAYQLIKHKDKGYRHMILEDEGRHIGKCYLPKALADFFKKGDLVLMDIPFNERVSITKDEYVHHSQSNYINRYGDEEGLNRWYKFIQNSIGKIKKRLGGSRYNDVMRLFNTAYKEQLRSERKDLHEQWIAFILSEYYDPMYEYQMNQVKDKIIFKGSHNEVLEYINDYYSQKF